MTVKYWDAYRARTRLRMRLQAEETPSPRTPGGRLRRARHLMDISLSEAADICGVCFSTFARREADCVSLEMLHKTAKALGIDPNYLDPRLASDGGRRFD